jgi:hypothetical protein
MLRQAVSDDPSMVLNRYTAGQFLVRAWEQVSLVVLARAWGLNFEPEDNERTDHDEH